MIQLQPYPEYKDSGVPWLGEIPAHWEVRKLRAVLKSNNTRNQPNLPLLSVVREKGVIQRNISNKDENHNYIPDDLSNYKVVHAGQFAMNKMKAWQGSYGVSKYTGLVSPAYYVFNLNGVSGAFFHIAVRSNAYIPFFTQASDGVRVGQWDLSQTRMREIPLFIPSVEEQNAIARFLDWETVRINKFIRNKRRLIALLKEQKQNVINQAVTRGINPDVKLKPSGVEWLGDIPEHWDVRRLRFVCTLNTGGKDTVNKVENGIYPFFVRSQKEEKINTFSYDGEAVLTAGDGAGVGKVFHYMYGKFDYHQRVYKFSDFRYVLGKYFFYYIKVNLHKEVMALSAKSTVDSLRFPMLRNFSVAFPNKSEQAAIVKHIEKVSETIDLTISRTEREIELIREYRARLISDVVTGKVDVRNIEVETVAEEELIEEVEDREEQMSEEEDLVEEVV